MKFVNWLGKFLGWFLSHALQGTITVIMSFMGLFSLFAFENTAMKVIGFITSFAIAYMISYWLGKVRGEDRS